MHVDDMLPMDLVRPTGPAPVTEPRLMESTLAVRTLPQYDFEEAKKPFFRNLVMHCLNWIHIQWTRMKACESF